jgi:hypothetical protein
MNCKYRLGLIVSNAPDAVVAIRPTTPGPDDFVVVTASEFEFGAPVAGNGKGTGILLDSSKGAIINSRLFSEEVNSQGTAIDFTDAGGSGNWISNNSVEVMYGNLYHATGRSIGLKLGDYGSKKIVDNKITMSIHAPAGAYWDKRKKIYAMPSDFTPPATAIGADIFAQRNVLSLAFYGKRSPGKDLVFEPDSADNTVFALNLPNGYTNNARTPTNRLVPNWPVGFDVRTPPIAGSGNEIVNDTPFTISAIVLKPGNVSRWTISDAKRSTIRNPKSLSIVASLSKAGGLVEAGSLPHSQTIEAGLTAGQFLILEPGDAVRFEYTAPPVWVWKALR